MSTWFLFTNAPGGNDTIISRWGPGASWLLTIEPLVGSNVVKFMATDSGQSPVWVVQSRISILASNWYNASYGIDGTNVWLQVNNEARTNAAWTSLFASSDPLGFGYNEILPVGNETGTFIDATGFWGRNLDTNDVRILYNNGSGLFFSSFGGGGSSGGTLTNSMISFWRMDDAADSTRVDAYDGNDLTDLGSNVAQTTGILTNAASFDGGNKTLSHADNAALSVTAQDFTLQCWVKLGSIADNQAVCGKWGAVGNYVIYVTGDKFVFFRQDASGGGNHSVTANTFGALSTGVWYHVVAVQDFTNSQLLIYVNNISDTSSSSDAGLDGTAAFTVGQFDGGGAILTGDVDLVGFWKRALTAGDVSLLYNSGAARDPVTNP